MKKDMIKRDNHEVNQFVRLTTSTFFDEQLTDAGCRLLIAVLNNAEDWNVNVTYYGNKFGWSPGKTAGAKKNLIECGYLKEDTEMTSKGRVYHYSICESSAKSLHSISEYRLTNSDKKATEPQENQDFSLHPISEVREPNLGNRSQETEVRKLDANNSNTHKSNSDKTNPEKNKEIKVSGSVSVSNHPEEATQGGDQNTNTPLQLKEDFFFSYGERPTEEKIIAYAEKKGYSREVGREIFLELHNKDFKNQKGTPIKGVEKYIDLMLSDRSKHSHSTSIDSFLEAVTPVNEVYIKNSINANKELSIDFQTSKLCAKEASIEYWNSISKDKNEYIRYMMKFIELNGYKSMANFKSYVLKHRERQVQNTGTTYL